jgi:hypothetical protein
VEVGWKRKQNKRQSETREEDKKIDRLVLNQRPVEPCRQQVTLSGSGIDAQKEKKVCCVT